MSAIPLHEGYNATSFSRMSPADTDLSDNFTESTESEIPRNSSARSSVTTRSEAITSTARKRTIYVTLKSVRIKTLLYTSLVAVMITMLAFGYDMGFSSPTLHDLDQNNGEHVYFKKTIYHDVFNALGSAGAIIGTPLVGWLADYSGRQFTIVLCSAPLTIGWFLIMISSDITGPLFRPVLFIGRFVNGMGIGGMMLIVPLYLAEISPKSLRGTISTLNQLAIAVGVLLPQALGTELHYVWLSVAALAILLVLVPLSTTLKESPRWLISHGRYREARRVLVWLRGPNYNVEVEQNEIETQLLGKSKLTVIEVFKEATTRPVFYPMILSTLVMFIQQFSGIKAVIYNGQSIYEQGGVKDAATVTAITIGGVMFVATIPGAILADILGRKILLVSGNIIMCLSMAALSVYDLLRNEPYCRPPDDPKCRDDLQPLAITAMIAYIIGFSTAWGALPWLIASELIPLRVRGIGVGVVSCFNWIFSMIVLLSFGSYQDAVKPWGVFLSFGIINLLSVIFVGVFIPETKGKSLEEIELNFNSRQKQYIPL
ncbi:uncharacterized protein [Dysidea avara]|uniref:uncharacterized protein isoform X2 n=1 Tax=Dysidea avara TaxID=196820 RepID=UPI00332536D9